MTENCYRFTVICMALATAAPALAQDHGGPDPHAGHQMPGALPDDGGADSGPICHGTAGGQTATNGSGTSRLPLNNDIEFSRNTCPTSHSGLHLSLGNDWMLMAHGYAWGVYTDQSGPRGDSGAFVQTMAMLSAARDTEWGRIEARTMLSLEPLMDSRGYPNLFATGETSRGVSLVDRQHPHDLFMELAARVDVNAGDAGTLYLYGGPVGEPALGPSAFMHRRTARYNPEAPITHHWFDATHISYGVVTLGYGTRTFQIEGSAFRGREPDEARWNIETPRLDSWSVRATWTPTPSWAVQLSHGRLASPEALHDDEDEARTTASVHYARGGLSAMLAFSAKDRLPGPTLTAWLAEANWDLGDHHTVFGRVESVAKDELFPDELDPLHELTFRVAKFQIGYAYRLAVTDNLNLALGGTVAGFAFPGALDGAYGRRPVGATVFARLSLGL